MRNTIQHPFNLHNYRSIRKLGTGISGSTFLVESTVEGTQQNNVLLAKPNLGIFRKYLQ